LQVPNLSERLKSAARGKGYTGREVPVREMTVYGVSFDIVGKQPIVLLKTQDGNKFLPIWIGHPEAAAILMKLQGSAPPRPMTHDLLTSILEQLETEVVRITVTELRENTFYARITLVQDGQEIEIDSRPSDAIAIAVRADAKIFASDEVIEESGIEFEGDDEEAEARIARVSALADLDPAEFRRFLDTVTPDQFAEGIEEGNGEAEDAESAEEEADD
jgi:bifunctional DNase/RNase